MVHDRDLLDRLDAYSPIKFHDTVYRATRRNLDPTTPSLAGGRWAPRDSVPVLYTSLERNGALSEMAFHLSMMTPPPSKPIWVHELAVSARSVLKLLRADLTSLGVDPAHYDTLNYSRTQEIGAAVAFLECDGLIAPSARWNCNNLMLFPANHALDDKLEARKAESIDWVAWLRDNPRTN